ncbi:bifunctional glutamate N-acetyltransferase/amino-acid acetyltransferase ArgJ [Clostridium cylindrosporum]|uniref:Arginine biosynthesis bifunctional protein ArgJ n=1 Tax=Clostridium cylindrosporum DSM 605 TaxID=1121307 RepID=A0A0J8D9E2_CLOCY|nr:bifunctional glutamate N-acetyltransferase/amino-acid acetyltransferase ArgJ [Clostridium cylindrosporum]KMT22655.1 arginine biosynthesis bifunctional protein ArgJ [Clostridium cylindrosporum DSM 605]
MKILEGKTITDVKGFLANGIYSGVKRSKKLDLCMIYSEYKAKASGTFTQNKAKAAPVTLNQQNIDNENIQAIVVNSGNANACTGENGYNDAVKMTEKVAECLNLKKEEVLVASTGIIGVPLEMDKILPGIEESSKILSADGGENAAKAILTTDTFSKEIAVEFTVGGKVARIAGMAKGSGMIHPNMATMLAFITTDVNISKNLLDKAFKESVASTYNMVSVDGDTSTNDMSIILANGACENEEIISEESADYIEFKKAIEFVNETLAKLIAKDGEGATKLLEVKIKEALTLEDARKCAKSVVSSNLFKCALFGNDANWGRIVCALGYSDANIDMDIIDVFLRNESESIQIVKKGVGINFDEDAAEKLLDSKTVSVVVNLKQGAYEATAWGCDLSFEYVRINGCYRT